MTIHLYLRISKPEQRDPAFDTAADEMESIRSVIDQTVIPKFKCEEGCARYKDDGEGTLVVTLFRTNKGKMRRVLNEVQKDFNWLKRNWLRLYNYDVSWEDDVDGK